MLSEIHGKIERITYTNEENGYTIVRLEVSGRDDLVTVIGQMNSPMRGEVIKIQGAWATHHIFFACKLIPHREI